MEENIVELLDENGETVRFEHLMTFEYGSGAYMALYPLDPMEDVGEDEVVIFEIQLDENGDDIYVGVEDKEELQKIYEEFLRLYDEEGASDE
jgi:uncharacterized protein YrzB (UPF0473 family)